ncbi:MAG: prepilin-type N-terminal cleavage/methylation domain-containing protein [Candidatus Buchananbacteria bacterium]
MKKVKGFTLIELLIVIGIIAILASIIYVSVDPGRRLGEARDAARWSSVNAILNAYLKSTVDQSGTEPASLAADGTKYMVSGSATAGSADCTAAAGAISRIDLSGLVTSGYLASLPIDEKSSGTDADTQYYISKAANGRITVGACAPERTTTGISVSR